MPFAGSSAADVIAHILEREPAPLTRYVKDAPVELQRIVIKALMKNREERYQSIKDLLNDLKELKQETEFAAKLQRSIPPVEPAIVQTSSDEAEESGRPDLVATSSATRPISSAEYIVNEFKQHKRGVAVALSFLLLAVIGLSYWFLVLRRSNVTAFESIAVLPFVNASGNPEVEYLSDGMSEAYQLYLKGRYHVLKLTLSEIQTGISYFQQAIAIDPSYALAYVGLAAAYRSALAGDMPTKEVLPKAKEAAQKAIEIDDTLADAHAELGFIIFWYDWDWNAAENQYKRALDLDQNSADAHLFYAHLLSNTGRHTEALTEVKRARELDPLNLRINA